MMPAREDQTLNTYAYCLLQGNMFSLGPVTADPRQILTKEIHKAFHCTALHCIALHCIPLHCIALCCLNKSLQLLSK